MTKNLEFIIPDGQYPDRVLSLQPTGPLAANSPHP